MKVEWIVVYTRFFVVLAVLSLWATNASGSGSVIRTNGEAVVEQRPDRAAVYFEVISKAVDALAATEKTAKKHAQIIESLRSLGLENESVATTQFRVDELRNRDRNTGEITTEGYMSTHGISVEVEDLASIGEIVDKAIESGATRLTKIRFWSSTEDAARDEALRLATNRAVLNAKIMSEASGGSLGDLIELSTKGRGIEAVSDGDAGSAVSAPTTIVPNKIKYRALVEGKWTYHPDK